MANLTLPAPQSSFQGLLNLSELALGLTPVLQVVQDGLGNNSPISLSTLSFKINTSMGGFYINDQQLFSTPEQIDAICISGSFIDFTTAIEIPVGTTAQRPSFPENGAIRYNNQTHEV